jgi:hypothetical protein
MYDVNGHLPTKWESPRECGVVASALTLQQIVMGSDCRVYKSLPSCMLLRILKMLRMTKKVFSSLPVSCGNLRIRGLVTNGPMGLHFGATTSGWASGEVEI